MQLVGLMNSCKFDFLFKTFLIYIFVVLFCTFVFRKKNVRFLL